MSAGSKQQDATVSPFWRSDVKIKVSGGPCSSEGSPGGDLRLFLASSGSRRSLLALGLWPRHSDLFLSSRDLLCVSVCTSSSYEDIVTGFRARLKAVGPHLNNYTCKGLISKLGHVMRVLVDMNFGEHYSTCYSDFGQRELVHGLRLTTVLAEG